MRTVISPGQWQSWIAIACFGLSVAGNERKRGRVREKEEGRLWRGTALILLCRSFLSLVFFFSLVPNYREKAWNRLNGSERKVIASRILAGKYTFEILKSYCQLYTGQTKYIYHWSITDFNSRRSIYYFLLLKKKEKLFRCFLSPELTSQHIVR